MAVVSASPVPILQFFNNLGQPNAGGSIITQVGGVNFPTYQDAAGSIPLPNPIPLNSRGEISNASGVSSQLFLQQNVVYSFTLLDAGGNILNTASSVQALSTISYTSIIYPQTAAEEVVTVVPVNFFYPPGNLLRYGTNTIPGTTDMSSALTNALAVGQDVYIPGGSYLFAQQSPFVLQSNQTVYGDGDTSILTFTSNNTSNLAGNAVTDTTVRNVAVAVTGVGTQNLLYIGVIAFTGVCTNCLVEDCDISGYSMIGVLLQDAVSCTVRRNYFHGVTLNTAAGDGAAVYLRGTSAGGCLYNVVTENQVFSNSYEGIAVLTGSGVTANTGLNKYNLIAHNRIGQQAGYGILGSYSGNGQYDLFNQIIGNYIENIQGTSAVAGGSSGAGIYCVGAGGLVITGNTIRNCCVQTANESLAPAGIGVNNTVTGATPCVVANNNISGMTQYHGIDVTSCSGAVQITGNTIFQPSSNSTGSPIKVNGSSQVSVRTNTVYNVSTENSIWVHIVANTLTQVDVCGNLITCAGPGIVFDVTSGSLTLSNVCDNNIDGSGAFAAITLAGIVQGIVKGNNISIGATTAMTISACTQLQVSANSIVCSSLSNALTTTGTCTGSYVDEANYVSATGGSNLGQNAVNNGGTGIFVRQLGSGSPGRAAHIVGDSVKNTAPTSNGTLEWVCTTAGSPGTWTAITIP